MDRVVLQDQNLVQASGSQPGLAFKLKTWFKFQAQNLMQASGFSVVAEGLDWGLFENNYFTEMCSGSEADSCLRLIDCGVTQL